MGRKTSILPIISVILIFLMIIAVPSFAQFFEDGVGEGADDFFGDGFGDGADDFFDGVGDGGDDFFGMVFSAVNIGVAHSGNGDAGKIFPSAVAGRNQAHQFCGQAILKKSLQFSPLNQQDFLRDSTLVINVVGTPKVRNGGIIIDVDQFTSDPGSLLVPENRGFFPDEIRFQQVSYGLVNENTAMARRQHHRHFP